MDTIVSFVQGCSPITWILLAVAVCVTIGAVYNSRHPRESLIYGGDTGPTDKPPAPDVHVFTADNVTQGCRYSTIPRASIPTPAVYTVENVRQGSLYHIVDEKGYILRSFNVRKISGNAFEIGVFPRTDEAEGQGDPFFTGWVTTLPSDQIIRPTDVSETPPT